jgi:hypothetical protein
MANYRIVTIASDGTLTRSRSFDCDNDADAIVRAKQSVDKAPIELWSGARFVTRIEPKSSATS